jgi:hypothetical protein
VAFAGNLQDILSIQEERVVANDNTVRYKNRTLQIPADRHRHHYVKARVRVHEYPDGHLGPVPWAALSGPPPGRRQPDRDRGPAGRVIRFEATGHRPVDKWTARPSRPDHFPTGPTTPTEAVNSYGT